MRVINYFGSDKKEHWLIQIKKANWGAAVFLHELLSKGTFFEVVGENSRVLLLTEEDKLISFCTYAEKDDIFRKQFSEIISSPTDAEPPAHFDYLDIFRFSCRIFEQHQRFFRCFYRANPAVYFETIVGQIIRSNNPADSIEPRAYYLYAARAWTGVGLMTEWLLRGCDLEIDALTDVLKGFFSKR